MFNKKLFVEEHIELLVGYQEHNGDHKFVIEKSDYNLLTSLGRQTLRGTAYTDRQYELVKQKLAEYKEQFALNGYDNIELNELRMPLRSIDRSRWIKIVKRNDDVVDVDYIGVRFSFNKKLISVLDSLNVIFHLFRLCAKETCDRVLQRHHPFFSDTNPRSNIVFDSQIYHRYREKV